MSIDTNKRGKKNPDILNSKISCEWNNRLNQCIKHLGYNNETFARLYKHKYGTGNTTDVYRWLNVGNAQGSSGKRIGFPSYDTMKRIADFFGVTVGYLTGETDYETFEMERVCNYLGITPEACTAIRSITYGDTPLSQNTYMFRKEQTAALCYLLTANNLRPLLEGVLDYAVSIDERNHPTKHLTKALSDISPDLRNLAWEERDNFIYVPTEDEPSPDPALTDAIFKIRDAIDNDDQQKFELERNVKVAKYELSEVYLRLIEEIVCDEHLSTLTAIYRTKFASVEAIKQFVSTEE